MFSCGLGPKAPLRPVIFIVFDVGQGLAQAVIAKDRAVLFDIGGFDAFPLWQESFSRLGNPFIAAIVISHDHADHAGGLALLDSGASWSGLLVTTPFVDTSGLRQLMPKWRSRLYFRIIASSDTLAVLENVGLACLWPPSDLSNTDDTGETANRFSLVMRVCSGASSALVTSDIDTFATRELSLREAGALASDIFVVPHHGSASARDGAFYGYVRPYAAIISCGLKNDYGHPAQSVVQWLSQSGIRVFMTGVDGSMTFQSNGFYWY
jgi:competence protein ComEC